MISGERGGQALSPPQPIQRWEKLSLKYSLTLENQCGDAHLVEKLSMVGTLLTEALPFKILLHGIVGELDK